MNNRSQRIVIAAAQAAIDEARATPQPKPKKHKLAAGRAVFLGAGLMTAGRIVAGPRARQLLGGLADRVEDLEARFTPDRGSECLQARGRTTVGAPTVASAIRAAPLAS